MAFWRTELMKVLTRLKLIEESTVDAARLTKGTMPPPRIIGANGIPARVSETAWAARAIIGAPAGVTVVDGDGVAGDPTLALADDLAALEALFATGFAVRTGASAWAQRAIAGTAPVTITNGDGVAGNPTVALSTPYVASTKTTVLTSSGTFTPDPKMLECEVWAWGGAGAGGGAPATGSGQVSVGSGGNTGARAYRRLTAAEVGASQTVTIGAGGTGVSGGTGNSGGNTSLGSLVVASGGQGGTASAAGAGASATPQGQGNSSTGDFTSSPIAGELGLSISGSFGFGGGGASTELGGRGRPQTTPNSNGLGAAANSGSAGGGGINGGSQGTARAGGAGGSGVMLIIEYLRP
jgi:hypothetical protein